MAAYPTGYFIPEVRLDTGHLHFACAAIHEETAFNPLSTGAKRLWDGPHAPGGETPRKGWRYSADWRAQLRDFDDLYPSNGMSSLKTSNLPHPARCHVAVLELSRPQPILL
jgi:hypothetical protein